MPYHENIAATVAIGRAPQAPSAPPQKPRPPSNGRQVTIAPARRATRRAAGSALPFTSHHIDQTLGHHSLVYFFLANLGELPRKGQSRRRAHPRQGRREAGWPGAMQKLFGGWGHAPGPPGGAGATAAAAAAPPLSGAVAVPQNGHRGKVRRRPARRAPRRCPQRATEQPSD